MCLRNYLLLETPFFFCKRQLMLQKSDPAQFLRIYGRPVKIHLDTAVALAAEAPQSM